MYILATMGELLNSIIYSKIRNKKCYHYSLIIEFTNEPVARNMREIKVRPRVRYNG